ncbi:uncharacterized protein AB675_8586 [Cyphellophora attinorum]|uniref:Uncharacterized protein n=1 Tax=Cyphellophora attinorum TaxID=1664694 RepID=A0A0N1P3X3_9EURO|nr:uncharacterized protein AB675_8586 [Phialophora attinorum]KPI44796.1 hypothetical protein AB675_8586 [Phialophora attinorum]
MSSWADLPVEIKTKIISLTLPDDGITLIAEYRKADEQPSDEEIDADNRQLQRRLCFSPAEVSDLLHIDKEISGIARWLISKATTTIAVDLKPRLLTFDVKSHQAYPIRLGLLPPSMISNVRRLEFVTGTAKPAFMALDVSELPQLEHIVFPRWLFPCLEEESKLLLPHVPQSYVALRLRRQIFDFLDENEEEKLLIPTADYLAQGQNDKGLIKAAHTQLSALARRIDPVRAESCDWTWLMRISCPDEVCDCGYGLHIGGHARRKRIFARTVVYR